MKRPYRSAVREEGARRTRRAIVAAAASLFTERGYGGASLADVAAAAGVSRPTVTATFGSKPALLREVLDQALAGDDEPVPVADRPWFRPVWQAQTHADLLTAYAHVCTLIGARASLLFEVVRRAADGNAEVAELWERTRRNRRAGATMVVDQLQRLPPSPEWLGHEAAVDALWIFNDPSHYDALVTQCGWKESDFTRWLALRMQDALLRG
ncbi:TetR/AcrR family transcriptional regulator [Pedococcus sp. NPDC057267]|uniref:TetR/AcrR family transcriptional regulator n=1 Tax=Pedococcus sp. NPDC057267 TaxID=3346077 RepID=UPI00364352A2